MKRKYVTTQLEGYNFPGVGVIDRKGVTVEDEELIARLEANPDYNVWFQSVPTDEEVEEMAVREAEKLLAKHRGKKPKAAFSEPVEVPRVSVGDLTEEEAAWKDEQSIRDAQEEQETVDRLNQGSVNLERSPRRKTVKA